MKPMTTTPMPTPSLPLSGICIVFDLDGTLVNTAPDLQATLNHVLESHGYEPVSAETTQTIIGHGAKAMLRSGLSIQGLDLPDDEIDLMFEAFLVHYAENIDTHSAPYPGCLEALIRLSKAGATLAVCTNKTQVLADHLLQKLGMTQYFATIKGADSVPNRKPHAGHILETLKSANGQPDRAIMIGDSDTDERAAHNAALPFLFVPFGYGPIEETPQMARHILEDFNHLSADLVIQLLES